MSERSKYGLFKNTVRVVGVPKDTPRTALVWLESRAEFEALLRDELDAFSAGIITRIQYDRAKARLSRALWTAEQNFELAMRSHRPARKARGRR